MAVNALGLPLQLQASPLQIQDLLGGLQPGDLLKARVVELLPEAKAIINLRGQNLVAQLPAGPAPQRGAMLDLQVTQSAPAEGAKTASLTLRLLPPAPPSTSHATAPIALTPLPPQAQIDHALAQARLPQNPVTQQVARTLAQLGVPLSPQNLQSAVQAVQGLLAAEQAMPPLPSNPVLAPVVAALHEAADALRLAAPLQPSGEAGLQLQQAVRHVQSAIQQLQTPAPLAPVAPQPPTALPAPTAPPLPSAPAASIPAPAAVPTAAPNAAPVVQAVQQAVQQVLAQPQAPQVQALQQLLQSLPSQIPAVAPAPAPMAPLAAPAAPAPVMLPNAVVATAPLPPPPPEVAVIQREALAPVLALVAQSSSPLPLTAVQALVGQLAAALQDPASPPAQRLVQAVQVQDPQAPPAQVLATAREALAAVSVQLAALPPQQPISSAAQLMPAFNAAGVAVPKLPLQSFPVEVVAEAVAWLQARDLPPQRPLVEAVAALIQQDHQALPAAQRAVEQAQQLPAPVLAAAPPLRHAVELASLALREATVHPESNNLAKQLQAWASQQGLDLEPRLLASEIDAPLAAPETLAGKTPAERPALRPALQQLEQQLQKALQLPLAQDAVAAEALRSALGETQSANRAFSAMPLQAQGAPAYDTVHMPLPVAMGADLGGQLSVTWRHGRDRELNEKDPVSVALALNTGALGKVKVLLQVWKDAASARVVAEDQPLADFLAEGADDLRQGFAERTPFPLKSLDFTAESGKAGAAPADSLDAPRGGLTLSA